MNRLDETVPLLRLEAIASGSSTDLNVAAMTVTVTASASPALLAEPGTIFSACIDEDGDGAIDDTDRRLAFSVAPATESGSFRLSFSDLVLPASGSRLIIGARLDPPLPLATLPVGFAVGCLALVPLVARRQKRRMSFLLVACGSSAVIPSACYYIPIGTLPVYRPGSGIQASTMPVESHAPSSQPHVSPSPEPSESMPSSGEPSATPVRIDLQGTLVSVEASGSIEGLPLAGDPLRLEGDR